MILDKSQMTEEDIKLNYITPAILSKWQNKVTMETRITDGRVNIKGNMVTRERPKKADYILWLNRDKPIAVVEAKDNNHPASFGLQQAITYAQMLDVPFAYSSNGDGFREHDFLTGQERDLGLDEFPSPDELTARWEENANSGAGVSDKEMQVINQPYYSDQNTYEPRYYQRNAVNRTVEAIVEGRIVGEDVYTSRTYMDAPGVDGTLFVETGRDLMTGDFIKVRITGSDQYDLIGEVED